MKNFLIGFFISIVLNLMLILILTSNNNIELKQEFKQKSCPELLTEFEMDLRTCEEKLIDAEAEAKYYKIQLRLK